MSVYRGDMTWSVAGPVSRHERAANAAKSSHNGPEMDRTPEPPLTRRLDMPGASRCPVQKRNGIVLRAAQPPANPATARATSSGFAIIGICPHLSSNTVRL